MSFLISNNFKNNIRSAYNHLDKPLNYLSSFFKMITSISVLKSSCEELISSRPKTIGQIVLNILTSQSAILLGIKGGKEIVDLTYGPKPPPELLNDGEDDIQLRDIEKKEKTIQSYFSIGDAILKGSLCAETVKTGINSLQSSLQGQNIEQLSPNSIQLFDRLSPYGFTLGTIASIFSQIIAPKHYFLAAAGTYAASLAIQRVFEIDPGIEIFGYMYGLFGATLATHLTENKQQNPYTGMLASIITNVALLTMQNRLAIQQ